MKFLVIVLVAACAAELCRGDFAPTGKRQRKLLKCLFHGQNPERCFKISPTARRAKRSNTNFATDSLEFASEYVCALTDYGNELLDHTEAMEGAGSCARAFPSVARTWKKFLKRRVVTNVIQPTASQHRNGSLVTVRFESDNLSASNLASTLISVDLVISRSEENDVETYGRYELSTEITQRDSEPVLVHKSIQATCPSSRRRYFVAALNNEGIEAISHWLRENGSSIQFSVNLAQQEQIVGDPARGENYQQSNFDIGPKISGMILHFPDAGDGQIFPPNDGIFSLYQGRRIENQNIRAKRNAQLEETGECRLVPYIVSYRRNKKIKAPMEYNFGECVGSCDKARISPTGKRFNATNHALNMLWEKLGIPTPGNPEPTVCCAPIAHRRFYFVVEDNRGLPMSTYAENMVAEYCGCR